MHIGFLGCSKIANKAIEALKSLEGVTLYGCSAQSFTRAQEFQKKYNIKHAYKSYEDMLSDPEIELVYISTLTSSHYKDTMLALKHVKHCIVEKPIAMTLKEADDILFYSEKHNLFVTEALMTSFHPSINQIKEEILDKNIIGKLFHLEANLSFPLKEVERLNNRSMGGGALYDLGVYTINICINFFGYNIKEINSTQVIDSKNLVDTKDFITIIYKDGKTANLSATIDGLTSNKCYIYGTKGYLEIEYFHHPKSVKIYETEENGRGVKLVKEMTFDDPLIGYKNEFKRTIEEVKSYQIESVNHSHFQIRKNMEIVEKIIEKSVKVKI